MSKLEEDKKWEDIAADLYVGDSEDDRNIDWILDMLRERGYSCPTK